MLIAVLRLLGVCHESLRHVKHIYRTSFGYLCQGLSLLTGVEINYIMCTNCKAFFVSMFNAETTNILNTRYIIHLADRPPG